MGREFFFLQKGASEFFLLALDGQVLSFLGNLLIPGSKHKNFTPFRKWEFSETRKKASHVLPAVVSPKCQRSIMAEYVLSSNFYVDVRLIVVQRMSRSTQGRRRLWVTREQFTWIESISEQDLPGLQLGDFAKSDAWGRLLAALQSSADLCGSPGPGGGFLSGIHSLLDNPFFCEF